MHNYHETLDRHIAPDKRGIQIKVFSFISPRKHILWYSLEVPQYFLDEKSILSGASPVFLSK